MEGGENYMKILQNIATVSLLFVLVTAPVIAAVGDGSGPWADSVVSSSQGLRNDGSAVLAARSDPTAAVGVAEGDTIAEHFFSLGFGGTITLGFENPVQSGVVVVEATGGTYPNETANVEVSSDNSTWYNAGSVTFDGTVALPENVCAKYVRITDTTNSELHGDEADAFDLDGVQAQGVDCRVPPPQVPEFGLVTGLIALATSAGSYMFLKKRSV